VTVPTDSGVAPLATGDNRPVLVVFTPKAGWFRRDDELAAHERAVRALGWCPVSLPVRPDATRKELAEFLQRARPDRIWFRSGAPLPEGFAEDLAEHPAPVLACVDAHQAANALPDFSVDARLSPHNVTRGRPGDRLPILPRPRGVDQAILDVAARPGPAAVSGDVSVIRSAPSPTLRSAVEQVQDRVRVVIFGDGWGEGAWFEPDGRAALTALASSAFHLAEVGPDGSVPHSAYCAAAMGAALILLGKAGGQDAFRASVEAIEVSSPNEAEAALGEMRADENALMALRRSARARVETDYRLEVQWSQILTARGSLR
jgi:hypothetical protein